MNALPAMLETDGALAIGDGGREAARLWSTERRVREAFADCDRLLFRDVEWFAAHAVSAFKLLGYRADPSEMGEAAFRIAFPEWPPIDLNFEVRRARVQFLRGGRFVFGSDKRAEPEKVVPAFVMPAVDDVGAMVDLVAWHPRNGLIGSSERVVGWLAGGHLSEGEPVIVHPDPLSWLRASRIGVVVIHEDLARPALLAQRTLRASDVAHGEILQAMLAKVRLPRIVVPVPADERIEA